MCDDVMSIFINKVCVACQYSLCFSLYIESLITMYRVIFHYIQSHYSLCIESLFTIYRVIIHYVQSHFSLYIESLFTIYDVMSIFINKVCVVCQYSLYIKYIGSLLTIYDVMSIFFNNEYQAVSIPYILCAMMSCLYSHTLHTCCIMSILVQLLRRCVQGVSISFPYKGVHVGCQYSLTD